MEPPLPTTPLRAGAPRRRGSGSSRRSCRPTRSPGHGGRRSCGRRRAGSAGDRGRRPRRGTGVSTASQARHRSRGRRHRPRSWARRRAGHRGRAWSRRSNTRRGDDGWQPLGGGCWKARRWPWRDRRLQVRNRRGRSVAAEGEGCLRARVGEDGADAWQGQVGDPRGPGEAGDEEKEVNEDADGHQPTGPSQASAPPTRLVDEDRGHGRRFQGHRAVGHAQLYVAARPSDPEPALERVDGARWRNAADHADPRAPLHPPPVPGRNMLLVGEGSRTPVVA